MAERLQGVEYRVFRSLLREWDRDSVEAIRVELTPGEEVPADPATVPAYYAHNRLNCDFWYKLLDIRRLVADDTIAVIAELKQLRNPEYHNRPVSLYGGWWISRSSWSGLTAGGSSTPRCAIR